MKVSPRLTIYFLQLSRSKDIFIPSHTHTHTHHLFGILPRHAPKNPVPLPSFKRVDLARFGPSLCFFQLSLASCGGRSVLCDCLFACSLWGFYCIVGVSSPFPPPGSHFPEYCSVGSFSPFFWLRFSLFGVSLASVFLCLISLPLPRAVPFYFSRFPFRSSLSPASLFPLQMRAKGYFN